MMVPDNICEDVFDSSEVWDANADFADDIFEIADCLAKSRESCLVLSLLVSGIWKVVVIVEADGDVIGASSALVLELNVVDVLTIATFDTAGLLVEVDVCFVLPMMLDN